MNITSKLWEVRRLNEAYSTITQRATNTTLVISTSKVPSADNLAQMHERKFDATMRELFHESAVAAARLKRS